MVDNMLVLARADAGGYQLRWSDCFVDEILDECIHAADVLASAKGVALESHVETGLRLRGDDSLLRQLALNVIENAIKHTPEGGSVRISGRRASGNIEIRVSDSGPGVAQPDRERIFERFVRLDDARATAGGAGLGLPIARWVAESHGGTLVLASTGPSGSTFIASLP